MDQQKKVRSASLACAAKEAPSTHGMACRMALSHTRTRTHTHTPHTHPHTPTHMHSHTRVHTHSHTHTRTHIRYVTAAQRVPCAEPTLLVLIATTDRVSSECRGTMREVCIVAACTHTPQVAPFLCPSYTRRRWPLSFPILHTRTRVHLNHSF